MLKKAVQVASILFFTLFFYAVSTAEIMIYDSLGRINEPIVLKAETKGFFFSNGGKLVEFFVNGEPVGKRLSGGDGLAFMEYLPHRTGFIDIQARSGKESDKGLLLVPVKDDPYLLIEIEEVFIKPGIMLKALSESESESEEDILKLIDKYRVIYVTTMLGPRYSKKWINEKNLPLSVIYKWSDTDLGEDLKNLDVSIYAVIASPEILAATSSLADKRYTFSDDEEEEESWRELLKELE